MSLFFWRKRSEADPNEDRNEVISYLRGLTSKDYEKTLKIVEIYRKADEDAKVVELGSKKAVRELEKETQEDVDLGITAEFEEVANE